MALNLSRNTKVFISSVNGVPIVGGAIKNAYVSVKGTGYAKGDIVTLATTSTSGANAKCIVLSIGSSGIVETIAIPNNFRGNGFIADETATQANTSNSVQNFAGTNNSGASGLIVTVVDVTGTTTAEGARTGTGRFKGNEIDVNCFRVGVLDGYSFSQGSESTDVTISEAGAAPNRGSKRFNDALPPAEWSFGTYVRPFKHGAASFRAVDSHDMVENILWSALAGVGLPSGSNNAVTVGTGSTAGTLVDFESSDVHELMKLNIYFVLENTT